MLAPRSFVFNSRLPSRISNATFSGMLQNHSPEKHSIVLTSAVIFLVSVAGICAELMFTSIIGIKSWSHMVYVVISFAMLGYGAGSICAMVALPFITMLLIAIACYAVSTAACVVFDLLQSKQAGSSLADKNVANDV
ncbi:MAG: hypothetical protein PHV34_24750 [Verrucomicrobiae bacterium]|nr:hypothetical protein [Verrucomicrobiae bacterium]